jgi:hypothetical protein
MKKRSPYWWIFVVSGLIWAVGYAGLIVGYFRYPDSNLLGGYGLVFGPISWLGGYVFIITFLIWIIHKIIRRMSQP